VIAILGSGFGLYGYLPALVKGCGQRVVLSERHREPFHERRELARFADDVQWERDEASVLDRADGVVLALQPSHQSEWIPRCLIRHNLECILVEKPLAPSPEAAGALLEDLARSGKVIRIGYTFRYTDWGQRIRAALKQAGESRRLFIQWSFLAHHFRHDLRNWKRFTDSGGGAIRFYGIQLIALLAELGYEVVISSHTFGNSIDVIEKWTASFRGPGLPECEVAVDTRSAIEKFGASFFNSAREPGTVLADLIDPFESTTTAGWEGLDRRVPSLSRLCRSLWEQTTAEDVWYKATIDLWRSVEERASFEKVVLTAKPG
jgi:predicted dehydrogenase